MTGQLERSLRCLSLCLAAAACSRIGLENPVANGTSTGPVPLPVSHPLIGLISAVGGPSRARVEWRAQAPAGELPHFAVFVGADPITLLAGSPAIEDPVGTTTILEGLPNDAVLFAGLGIRSAPGDAYVPSGPALRLRTGAPIYVDPAAPSGGDGTTPQTAFSSLSLGIATAFSVHGGGNVWVRGGEIQNASMLLYGGVYLSGGFDAHMALRFRDTVQHPTRITGSVNHSIFNLTAGNGPCVLDGFDLDGLGTASNGVRDEAGLAAEIRSLNVQGCFRGIKLRAPQTGPSVPVIVAGVLAQGNRAEGLDLDGPFDLSIESSVFQQNAFEGVRLKYLFAPENGSASLVVRGCDVQRNGRDGLECRMLQPPGAGHAGGRFRVHVQDSDFEQNADRGMVLNLDYDLFPEWSADIQVLGCRFRANRNSGVDLHLDSTSTTLVERIASSANGAEGLKAKGTSLPVMGTVSASALFGNQGAGAGVSEGNAGLLLSHCVLSGNFAGGLVSLPVPSAAVSCVAWLQREAWSNALAHDSPSQELSDPQPFLRAAREYAQVSAFDGVSLTLATAPSAAVVGPVELADDGLLRTSTSLSANVLVLAPVPSSITIPNAVGFFPSGRDVTEDLRLSAGSIAVGAGMSPPSAPAVDAGIFSSPRAGPPGREDALPAARFFLGATSPPWTGGLASDTVLTLSFTGGSPDPASVQASVFAVDRQGHSLAITPFVDGDKLRVAPPPGGWSTGTVLELHAALRSISGARLAAPVALPLTVP